MLASAPKHKYPKKQVPVALPVFDPIGLLDTETGFVKLQDAKSVAIKNVKSIFFIVKGFNKFKLIF